MSQYNLKLNMNRSQKTLLGFFITCALALTAMQMVVAQGNTRQHIESAKQDLVQAHELFEQKALDLCEVKIKELRENIGNGDHTNDDLIYLSKLNNEGEVNSAECNKLTNKVLDEQLGK